MKKGVMALIGVIVIVFIYSMSRKNRITRAQRWEGSFRMCMANATAEEIKRFSGSLPNACGCLATYLISNCAKTDKSSSTEVGKCANEIVKKIDVVAIMAQCAENKNEQDTVNPFLKT